MGRADRAHHRVDADRAGADSRVVEQRADHAERYGGCERPAEARKGPRQVIEVEINSTMTSCGYGVPIMEPVRQRRVMDRGRRYKDSPARVPVAVVR